MIEYVSWFWEPMFGEVREAWIPLAMAAAGMAMGAYQGHRKQQAAQERDQFMGNMAALDTLYSKQVTPQGYMATYTAPGPGAIGGGLSGAFGGYQQGADLKYDINKGKADSAYAQMIKDRRARQVAQGGLSNIDRARLTNQYAMLGNYEGRG